MNLLHPIIMDSCCVFNIHASGISRALFETLPVKAYISEYVVENELIDFGRLDRLNDERSSFQRLIGDNVIEIMNLEDEQEINDFLTLCQRYSCGNGELSCIALAKNRSLVIATDDGKATIISKKYTPSAHIITTPEIVKYYIDNSNINNLSAKQIIESIEINGRYSPNKDHFLYDWWNYVKGSY